MCYLSQHIRNRALSTHFEPHASLVLPSLLRVKVIELKWLTLTIQIEQLVVKQGKICKTCAGVGKGTPLKSETAAWLSVFQSNCLGGLFTDKDCFFLLFTGVQPARCNYLCIRRCIFLWHKIICRCGNGATRILWYSKVALWSFSRPSTVKTESIHRKYECETSFFT